MSVARPEPLQKDLPVHGKRVDIELFTEADLTDEYIGWLNDPAVVRYSNQRLRSHDRSSCAAYLRSFERTDNLFMIIRRKDNGRPIGTMTVYFSPHHGTADVGILIGDTSCWGQGYGKDAWNAVICWLAAHARIRKVTAGTASCNLGMIKLIEASGMHQEAVRRFQEIIDGEAVDILYFARYRET